VIEKVTPATVIIDAAMVERTARALRTSRVHPGQSVQQRRRRRFVELNHAD
jgi:hypothetical protein